MPETIQLPILIDFWHDYKVFKTVKDHVKSVREAHYDTGTYLRPALVFDGTLEEFVAQWPYKFMVTRDDIEGYSNIHIFVTDRGSFGQS